ncbi:aspartic peptidase domain-containing protein [Cokeromyces recurvatus]|uniref:aspartic peptidase domain-containing protein n=1 Tax=Cokeromyces recurvatus TaxID=90255 RepID=UPI00221F0AAE|nr:aspartic peptidase domain-containing protein [Cokeromyces recurvatus]KAI7898986.1 aspartic peptidase domain-containing protein [Cokeromyces recurvatus]
MKSATAFFLISSAITVVASKLITVPFIAAERKILSATADEGEGNTLGTPIDVPLENIDLAYLIDISFGTPPQLFSLLLDTGSSSTWVPAYGCRQACGFPVHTFVASNSSTLELPNRLFGIQYGEGFASGYYAKDTATIDGVPIPQANFAISTMNDGDLPASGADGILGIGPDQLTVYNNPEHEIVPTLITTMFQQNIIDHNMFSIYFQPVNFTNNRANRINGEIVFGGGNIIETNR